MKNLLTTIAILALTLAMGACAKSAPAQLVEQAEMALANDDIEGARACCNELSDMTDAAISPSLLCRQALVYAQLAENGDDSQDMAAAAQCLDKAFAISADSVADFYLSVDVECKAQLELVKALTSHSNHGI